MTQNEVFQDPDVHWVQEEEEEDERSVKNRAFGYISFHVLGVNEFDLSSSSRGESSTHTHTYIHTDRSSAQLLHLFDYSIREGDVKEKTVRGSQGDSPLVTLVRLISSTYLFLFSRLIVA